MDVVVLYGEHLRIVLLEEAMDVVVLYGEHLRIV